MTTGLWTLLATVVIGGLVRLPLALVMFAGGAAYLFATRQDIGLLVGQVMNQMTAMYVLVAIPMFILAANIMNAASISDRLWAAANALVGRFRGGMGHVTVVVSMIFSSMSGSAVTDAAGPGLVATRQMQRIGGYPPGLACAITAAAATIAPIIPPSIPLVIYALISGASIGALFLAGVIPGLLIAGALMAMVVYVAKKRDLPRHPFPGAGQLWVAYKEAHWALMTPVILFGGMMLGIFTPTEAGGVGVLYCLIVGKFVYKGLKKEHFIPILRETISGTATVMLIIVSATVFGYYLNWENIPTMLLNAVTSFASNKFLVLLVMNVVLLIVGMFLEGGAALIILAPLMVPIVKAAGIDLVHFGIVCNVNIMIGGLTPPFGSMMFTCVSITGCKMQEFIKECVPFIIALLIALLLLTYIPGISMLIPNLIY